MAVPYETLFHILVYSTVFRNAPEGNEARLLQRLVDATSGYGYRTDVVPTIAGARVAAESDMSIGCFLLAIDGTDEPAVQHLVQFIRQDRGLDTPVYLLSEFNGVESLSLAPMGDVTGYVYLDNETPGFTAKEVIFAIERYAADLKPPFFGALMDYDYEGNQMWTCPGHQGGTFYRRSPAGRLFVDHLGEAVFRNDIDNSVPELGDLLIHAGPALPKSSAPIGPTSSSTALRRRTRSSPRRCSSAAISSCSIGTTTSPSTTVRCCSQAPSRSTSRPTAIRKA
jgi:ornithine decarboxylase